VLTRESHCLWGIPTILGNRCAVNKPHHLRGEYRATVRRVIERSDNDSLYPQSDINSQQHTSVSDLIASPSLYLLNAASLAKPHAIELLAADLVSYGCDVAVITESHFKNKHTAGAVSIVDYSVFRRDRLGRKGGGVAVYVGSTPSH